MKNIILSEGKNDIIFLKELLIKKMVIEESNILFFDQNSEDVKKNLKFIEDKYFNKLQSEWLTYKLLVKSEGGKLKIIDITSSKLIYLCKQRYNPIMLIDLDGGKIENFTNKLKEKLVNKFKGINLHFESNELHKVDEALMHSIKLFKDSKHIGTIYVIGFYSNLECTTGINNKSCTIDEKINTIQDYVKKSQIHEMFSKALAE
ncbi:MAG: hypothetical protein ABIJ74_03830 [archaeon]